MRRTGSHLLAAFLFTVANGQAALRFGLGDAVARRGSELIDHAGTVDPANSTGDSVAATLPSCPAGALYDSAPTDLSLIGAIDPLGHVAPSPHTFPSDHLYFYNSTGTIVTSPAYAPGNIHITDIASTEYLSASPVFTDYAIYFYPCKDVKTYFGHIRTLSASLQTKLAGVQQNCSTYSTGGSTYHRCDTNVNIEMNSGDLIGNSSGAGAFDFGNYDYRQTPLPFLTPSRHYGDQPYTTCAIDYFTPALKSTMQGLLGRYDGGYRRTTAPLCGQINFDAAGSAKGDWFHPGSPDSPEDPHLALIDNNVYAPQQTISIGTSVPNQSPNFYTFVPNNSGFVNRDFSQVTVDGNLYCYDTFYDPVGQLIGSSLRILIQLTSATTLRIESQASATCGSGPWSFTANTADFQR